MNIPCSAKEWATPARKRIAYPHIISSGPHGTASSIRGSGDHVRWFQDLPEAIAHYKNNGWAVSERELVPGHTVWDATPPAASEENPGQALVLGPDGIARPAQAGLIQAEAAGPVPAKPEPAAVDWAVVGPKLAEAGRVLLQQFDAVDEFVMGGALTNQPFMMMRDALALLPSA